MAKQPAENKGANNSGGDNQNQPEPAKTITLDDFGGNITLKKCRRHFGEELGKVAFEAVCAAGDYGTYGKREIERVSLAAPIGDTPAEARKREEINTALSRVK